MDEMHDKGRTIDAPARNLCREALPLLGEVARSAEGVAGVEFGAGEKRKSGLKFPCHCETSAHTGRGNPRPPAPHINTASAKRETDSHVASAPRNDKGGLNPAVSFPNRQSLDTGDPSVGLTSDSSPKRGAKRDASNPRREAPPLCKGRWVGASRAGGIAQQTAGQAPISGESVSAPAADNPSVAPRQLPLHKGAESDLAPAAESPLLRAHFARLCAEADALHRADPGFDLDSALRDPAFVRLTAPDVGVPVADAWYALHRREYAETLRRESLEQAAAAVASGSLRPREGGRASGGELLGTDPRHMTAAQRAELRDRIKRGERVYPR